MIVAPSPGAATWLVADVLEPDSACFGWRRRTLETLANELALLVLARAEEVPVRRLGLEAMCARVCMRCRRRMRSVASAVCRAVRGSCER